MCRHTTCQVSIATLRFTPQALAGIFMGTITQWNDPALTEANPGVSLPDAPIMVVHRSDGSGTTYVWTDYLSKVSDEWQRSVGRSTSVKWPVGTGASGNQGVAEMIKATPNAIGYVELTYAIREQLAYGDVQNAAGRFVKADFASVTAAAAESAATMPPDFPCLDHESAGRSAPIPLRASRGRWSPPRSRTRPNGSRWSRSSTGG